MSHDIASLDREAKKVHAAAEPASVHFAAAHEQPCLPVRDRGDLAKLPQLLVIEGALIPYGGWARFIVRSHVLRRPTNLSGPVDVELRERSSRPAISLGLVNLVRVSLAQV